MNPELHRCGTRAGGLEKCTEWLAEHETKQLAIACETAERGRYYQSFANGPSIQDETHSLTTKYNMASLQVPVRGKSGGTPTTKAVILVGGPSRGTRFRPLSLDVPKVRQEGRCSVVMH